MPQMQETQVAPPAGPQSASRSQFLRQLFSSWPYLFIIISVVGLGYIFWHQLQR